MNANNGVLGCELMAFTDTGPHQGVSVVADINAEIEESYPVNLLSDGSKPYLGADDGVHGEEFWEYDPACR